MPIVSRFFGIIIRMFYDEHNPPHFHAEYQGNKALFDLNGNMLRGDLKSKTARKLVREWVDLHSDEIAYNWEMAMKGQALKKIDPLD